MLEIFKKIKEYLKKLFGSSNVLMIKEKNTVSDAYSENNSNENVPNKQQTMRSKFEEERKIAEIQRKYELGEIKEEDIPDEEKNQIIELYKRQIQTLQERKTECLRQIDGYKKVILSGIYKLKEKQNQIQ